MREVQAKIRDSTHRRNVSLRTFDIVEEAARLTAAKRYHDHNIRTKILSHAEASKANIE